MGGPLRILHAVVNMNRGGAETLIMNLYRNIDKSRVQFDFLTCKKGVFDEEITAMGGRIHRIPYVTDIGHFGYVKALNTFFSSHQDYKIVHSHMDKMSGLVLYAAKKAGIPIRIAHSHNTNSEGGAVARAYKTYAGAFISKGANHLLACSELAANWLFLKRANKALILKNGIECDKFAFSSQVRNEVREELQLGHEHVVIGHVGRFNEQKNHLFLIDIFAKLLKEKPEAILIMAGDGPLREKVVEKVRSLNLTDHVKFLGIRSDINRLLQAFDFFVFPSFHEGLPVTLVEAQCAGLPCVISKEISKEVDLGLNLVEFASLSEINQWVEKINSCEAAKMTRQIPMSTLSEKGYDIKNTAKWTENFYMSIAR
ncbi:glycosyltransferase family 1 protein [Bacillus dakarensis]|uniref:glycosyltransferase family 1 protein n=1 Tax=Robertmurraya dakarensis TaxID=1926278 RepID=UPI000980D6C2|nr:glycosyltransferase family 1 protein [Bacillus dakarensis]